MPTEITDHPLATREHFNAALPPAPSTGAVADAQRALVALRTERRDLTAALAELDAADQADAVNLVDAALIGAEPASPPDLLARLHLEHQARRIDRAINIADRRLATARTRDGHWIEHRARCDRWLHEWLTARVDVPTDQGGIDVRRYRLDALAAELAAAQ